MTLQTISAFLIPRRVWVEMLELARTEAPLEACGLLAGPDSNTVDKFYPLTNIDQAAEHFSMAPKEQFAAIKDMRRRGLSMNGIWHSHPATPPRMSPEDLRLAFTPNVVYVITSLAEPGAPTIAGFRRQNKQFDKVTCRII